MMRVLLLAHSLLACRLQPSLLGFCPIFEHFAYLGFFFPRIRAAWKEGENWLGRGHIPIWEMPLKPKERFLVRMWPPDTLQKSHVSSMREALAAQSRSFFLTVVAVAHLTFSHGPCRPYSMGCHGKILEGPSATGKTKKFRTFGGTIFVLPTFQNLARFHVFPIFIVNSLSFIHPSQHFIHLEYSSLH
jgi:hypothetical protein